MMQVWKSVEISALVGCVVIAFAIAAGASAQSDESNRDRDEQQSNSQSQRDSDRDSDKDRSDREGSRQSADRQSGREYREQLQSAERSQGDRDQRSDGVQRRESQNWSRDDRRAPEMFDRQAENHGRSSEQGGLGVAVDDSDEGVRVVRVYRGTPAEEMGLRTGDQITRVDGRRVNSAREFIARIRSMEPGEEVELAIQRDDQERSLSGELESRAEALPQGGPQGYQDRRFSYGDSSEQRGYVSSQSDRGEGNRSALNRLASLERQLDQLRRELQQLRSTLEGHGGFGRSSGRESSVFYYQNQPRWAEDRYQTRQSGYDGPWQSSRSQYDENPSRESEDNR